MTKRRSRGTRALLEELGSLDGIAEAAPDIAGKGMRVVTIVLERIRPDPAQPRRVLPEAIRREFSAGNINARQALERWEALVAEEAARRGRPRPDWAALLNRDPDATERLLDFAEQFKGVKKENQKEDLEWRSAPVEKMAPRT